MIADASTPNTPFSARKALGAIIFAIALLVLGSAIVTPAQSADATTTSCTPPAGHFGNYQSADQATPIPAVPFQTATGAETTLGAYAGRGIVLNFWATWCAPCVREMPQLDRLSAFVRDNGIDVLTISEDRKGLIAAPKFYKAHNLRDLPVLADKRGKLMRAFKAPGLPLTVLINAAGHEVGRVVGPAEWDSPEIVEFVRSCLSPDGA